jgi:hypothetical protein
VYTTCKAQETIKNGQLAAEGCGEKGSNTSAISVAEPLTLIAE